MSRWGDEKTLKFVILYRKNECLWNPRSSEYKNNIARNNAYQDLLTIMDDPTLTIKIESSKRSGFGAATVYKPSTSWFQEMHSFLRETGDYREPISVECFLDVENTEESSQSISNLLTPQSVNVLSPSPFFFLVTLEETHHEVPPVRHKPVGTVRLLLTKTSSGTRRRSAMRRYGIAFAFDRNVPADGPNHAGLSPSPSPTTEDRSQSQSTTNSSTRCRKRRIQEEPITYALDRLENISTAINRQAEYDEFHYFAQNVAAQLRALPLYEALDVQNEIQAILTAARHRYQYPNLSHVTQTMTVIPPITNTSTITSTTTYIPSTNTQTMTSTTSQQDSTIV